MMHQTYAVLGLGRYGMAVATELLKNGAEVLAVDVDEAAVNAAATELPLCKCADVTDREVIRRLGIASMDVVIVAMAKHLEASVLATMLCKEAGVRTVIVKCSNEMHCKILSRVGADRVVFPENESGVRLAKNLLSAGFLDIIDLSGEVSMIELGVRPEWEGRSLSQLDLRRKYSINVVAIKREGEVYIDIDPSEPLEKEMSLIVIANRTKLAKLK
jgi:trk system potassium uptake protein TrkA